MSIPWRLRVYESMTLKRRIVYLFALGTLIPFICTAIISYNAISTILKEQVNSSIRNNLQLVQLSLENTINNLNHVSQQLAFPGSIGMKLDDYLRSTQPYERARLNQEINREINAFTFTNPGIGLTMYYLQDSDTFMFNNYGIKNRFHIDTFPVLAKHHKIINHGPHISFERYSDQYVLSAWRQVDLPSRDNIYVYIESGFNLTHDILQTGKIGERTYHLLLNDNYEIAYSEQHDRFPVQSTFAGAIEGNSSGKDENYYWFMESSGQGWSIISLIPISLYNQEVDRWISRMIYLALIFGILSLFIAWLLWKMVYKPLRQFSKEIKAVTRENKQLTATRSNIPEFDYLLNQIRQLKLQVGQLINEVELKEKRRADLEVEKLVYQINPHFLMNTLDTVHWLAVINGQQDINRLVSSLNKLLYYNLGKLGQDSTIREELDSLQEYLTLQQIRYDFNFDVRIHADEKVLNQATPRFILQPLVENALYHGLDDDGYIEVEVKQEADHVVISVQDNGKGLTDEEIERILHEQPITQQKSGMGIGMNYVKRMINSQYSEQAKLEIISNEDSGTLVRLILPSREERVS